MGRKPAFSDSAKRELFLKAISLGLSNERACDYAGVCHQVFWDWSNRAEADRNANKETIYTCFIDDYKKAKGNFVMRHTARITQASDNGSWQASAWLLERRCPEEFAQQNKIQGEIQRIEVLSDVPTVEREKK